MQRLESGGCIVGGRVLEVGPNHAKRASLRASATTSVRASTRREQSAPIGSLPSPAPRREA
ncbi:MAG TPA: hypothetical protein VGR90_03610, partial [Acidimicrobiales bacterium]|nr:hypothetical protein [Acidimicrobiales bacterium]